jgi:hypothetical protein
MRTSVERMRKYMSSIEAPFLAIWEAMNLIQEAQEYSDVADLPEILAKAEMVLSNVLKELVQNANEPEHTSSFRELSSENSDPLGLPGFQHPPDLDGRHPTSRLK